MTFALHRQLVTLEGSQQGYFAHLETRYSFAPISGEIRPVEAGLLRVILSDATEPWLTLSVPGGKWHRGRLVWWPYPDHGADAGTIGWLIETGRAEERGIRVCGQEPDCAEPQETPPIMSENMYPLTRFGLAFTGDGPGRAWLHRRGDGAHFAAPGPGLTFATEAEAIAYLASRPAPFARVEAAPGSSPRRHEEDRAATPATQATLWRDTA